MLIPSTFADISPSWLTERLRAANVLGPGEVTSVEVETTGLGVAWMSAIARLRVSYRPSAAGPPTMVAKLPSAAPANRALGRNYRLYEKEVRFYRELADVVPVRTPAAYVAEHDPATDTFVLVLEDLAPAVAGDELVELPDERVLDAVTAMARLHRVWWGDEGSIPRWVTSLADPPWDAHQQLWETSWPAFEARHGEDVPPALRECAELLVQKVGVLRHRLAVAPTTVAHVDFRLSNLFFTATGVAVVDWQAFASARGPYDVGYFLSQSIPPAQRSRLEDAALEEYLDGVGTPTYGMAELVEDYRAATAYCLLYPVATAAVDLGGERGRRYAAAMVERSGAAAAALDLPSLVRAL